MRAHPARASFFGSRRMPSCRDAARILALLAVYMGLTVWLTWPLAASLGSKLPCPARLVCYFDVLYSAWAVSWISHALTTAPWQLADANIYFPDPQALYYGPAALGAALYALPAYALTGNAAIAINVVLLVSVALTAC